MLHGYVHTRHGKTIFDYMKEDLKKQGYQGIVVDATASESTCILSILSKTRVQNDKRNMVHSN